METKTGVYICHCGINVAGYLDVEAVAKFAGGLDSVKIARHYIFMCSEPGQELIKQDIKELGLNRVVVASCSPTLHLHTFRRACESAGLNPYLCEMATIREFCSWVHSHDRAKATSVAKGLVAETVRKVTHNAPLEVRFAAVNPATLVLGAGVSGMQAAIEIASSKHKVYLVEREPNLGGNVARLDKTFPDLIPAADILRPMMDSVTSNTHIELMTCSELTGMSGYIGNFKAGITRKARYVDQEKCNG
ncbi:MAG: NAD(P)-binding protein, partial [Chloroflexota bacterium]